MLNRGECKKFLCWDSKKSEAVPRIVIDIFFDGSCFVVCKNKEDEFYSGKPYVTTFFRHYEEIPEPQMRPMTEAEILGWQAHAKGWVIKHTLGAYTLPRQITACEIFLNIGHFLRAPITESGVIGEWIKFELPVEVSNPIEDRSHEILIRDGMDD